MRFIILFIVVVLALLAILYAGGNFLVCRYDASVVNSGQAAK
jgi:hypothetical protein